MIIQKTLFDFSIATTQLSIMTFSITTFSIMPHSLKGLLVAFSIMTISIAFVWINKDYGKRFFIILAAVLNIEKNFPKSQMM